MSNPYREPGPVSEQPSEPDEPSSGQSAEAFFRLVRAARVAVMKRQCEDAVAEFLRQHPSGVAQCDPEVLALARAMLGPARGGSGA